MRLGQSVASENVVWPGHASVRVSSTTSTVLVLVMTARNGTLAPADGAVSPPVEVASSLASLVLSTVRVMVEVSGFTGSSRFSDTTWAGPTVTFWAATVVKPAGVTVSTTQYVPGMTGVSEQLPEPLVVQGNGGFTTTPGAVPVSV